MAHHDTCDANHSLCFVPASFQTLFFFASFGITETVTATLLMDLYCYWVAAGCIFNSFYVAFKMFHSPPLHKHKDSVYLKQD